MFGTPESELWAAFRRRVDAKIEHDLAEEARASERLREDVLATLKREVQAARASGSCGRVWLFGSFAWGQPHPESDIDLLVEGDEGPVARRVGSAARREIHALRVDEAPEALRERVFEEGVEL